MRTAIIELYNRDLDRLAAEISAYQNDEILWSVEKEINNSAGNLAIHIVGNLNHFIGATLGHSGYIRDRKGEFNNKHISRQTITSQIEAVKKTLSDTLDALKDDDLDKVYPLEVFKKPMTTRYFLIHLYGHLNYHLGQINYHRRLLD